MRNRLLVGLLTSLLIFVGAGCANEQNLGRIDNPTDPSSFSLNDLGDVNAPSPNDDDSLTYDSATGTWVPVAVGGGTAPSDATYITQTANGSLTAEQALGALATGILKNTTTTGVLSIATDGTDYISSVVADTSPQLGGDLDLNTHSITGMVIGTNIQAYDAGLADMASLAVTDSNFIVGNGTNWVAESGSTARTSIGLGSVENTALSTWAGSGNITTVGTISSGNVVGGIADKGLSISKLADGTDGELLTWGADGVITTVAVGTSGQVLTSNGAGAAPTFQAVAGTGDVVGPAGATDNAIARYDSTTGKLLQDSGVIIDDNEVITGVGRYIEMTYQNDTYNVAPFIKMQSARAGDADLQDNDYLGDIRFYGRSNGTYQLGAVIGSSTDGTPGGATDMPSDIFFQTSPDASATPVTRLTIGSDGTSTFAGTVALGANNLTMTGSLGATGSRLTKGWFTDLEVTNAIAGSITGNAVTVTGFTPASGTLTLSGADALTLTTTAATDVTLPTTGTLATLAGTETLSGKTLTAPKFADLGFIADANGNEMIVFDTVGSAVNYFQMANSATGNAVQLAVAGTDTDIGLEFRTKALGAFSFLGDDAQSAHVRFYEDQSNGSNYVEFASPAALTADYVVTLPSATGTLALTSVASLESLGTVSTSLTGVLRADSGVLSVDGDITDLVSAASTTVAGKIKIATAAETTTGTSDTLAVSPDALAGSAYGKRVVELKIMDDATAVTTGDGKLHMFIPSDLTGYNLVDVDAAVSTVSSSGTPTIALYNVTDSTNPLSTDVTIDANEKTSYTAATQPVINTSYDDVATGDELRIDVDVAGTGAKGLTVILVFQLP